MKKIYQLKNKNIPLIDFSFQAELTEMGWSEKFEILWVNEEQKNMLPIWLDLEDDECIKKFVKSRKIPNNRKHKQELMEVMKEDNLMNYVDTTFALSLNDSFWIIPLPIEIKDLNKNCVIKIGEKISLETIEKINEVGDSFRWEEYNLYENNFNEKIGLIAFEGGSYKSDEFLKTPEYTTEGMLEKCWIRENEKIYLIKGSSNISYDYYLQCDYGGIEPYLEFYTNQVESLFEFESIKYEVFEYRKRLVSKCEVFTNENFGYVPMYKLIGNEKEYLKKAIEIYGIENFQDLMIFDVIIGNTDRHFGNFGMIINNDTNEIVKTAPIFDNGHSFLNNIPLKDLMEFQKKEIVEKYIYEKSTPFNIRFINVLKLYSKERHIKILEKLVDFQFEKHPNYNIEDEALEMYGEYVKFVARKGIEILKN